MSPEQYKKMFPDDSETLGRMQSWGGDSKVAAKRQPWTYTKEVTETITVEDVYPGGISIPPGYEEVGFRPPLAGEPFLRAYIEDGVVIGSGVWFCSGPFADYPRHEPRILLKQKDLCFKVGDCFEVRDKLDGCILSYIRVTGKNDLVASQGEGLVMFRGSAGSKDWGKWACHDASINLEREQQFASRREISRREFDALFIEKIVNRVPA